MSVILEVQVGRWELIGSAQKATGYFQKYIQSFIMMNGASLVFYKERIFFFFSTRQFFFLKSWVFLFSELSAFFPLVQLLGYGKSNSFSAVHLSKIHSFI
jgi:uncharacterized membrane protein